MYKNIFKLIKTYAKEKIKEKKNKILKILYEV